MPDSHAEQIARRLADGYRDNARRHPADAPYWDTMARGAEAVAQAIADERPPHATHTPTT